MAIKTVKSISLYTETLEVEKNDITHQKKEITDENGNKLYLKFTTFSRKITCVKCGMCITQK